MNIVNQGLPIPADFYIELRDKISDIMYLGTGIKPAENESYYEPNHVDDTERYRDDILKELTKRELEILCSVAYFLLSLKFLPVLKIMLSSSSKVYQIGTTCGIIYLLIVPNFPVKVPCKSNSNFIFSHFWHEYYLKDKIIINYNSTYLLFLKYLFELQNCVKNNSHLRAHILVEVQQHLTN